MAYIYIYIGTKKRIDKELQLKLTAIMPKSVSGTKESGEAATNFLEKQKIERQRIEAESIAWPHSY